VRLLNLVLFGNGCYRVLAVVLNGLLIAWMVYWAYNSSGAFMWTYIASAAECAVNALFGYRYCRDQRIDLLIRELEDYGVDEHTSTQCLSKFVWWAFVGCAVCYFGPLIVADSIAANDGDVSAIQYALPDIVSSAFTSLQIYYLCACWAWSNWAFYAATKDTVAHGLTADNVANQSAGQKVHNLMECMHWVSGMWAFNHFVRFFTMLVLATAYYEQFVQNEDAEPLHVFVGLAAAGLYLVVWATAAAPGYVTTTFVGRVQRRLGVIAYERSSDNEPVESAVTALMQRLEACRSETGMHFAGVPMTVQKALVVGVSLAYVICTDYAYTKGF
jgi:hypothetical protein